MAFYLKKKITAARTTEEKQAFTRPGTNVMVSLEVQSSPVSDLIKQLPCHLSHSQPPRPNHLN
jgi:hypothetical protein